jgi:hypothetical protein
MSLINYYSFVFAFCLVIILMTIVVFRKGISLKKIIGLGLVFAGLIVIWFVIKPTQNVNVNQDQSLQLIGNGTPVLLEFQSPY